MCIVKVPMEVRKEYQVSWSWGVTDICEPHMGAGYGTPTLYKGRKCSYHLSYLFSLLSLPYSLRQDLSLSLEITNLARLAVKQAPGILSCLGPSTGFIGMSHVGC